MKLHLAILFCFLFCNFIDAQKLYDSLYFEMPIKDAKLILKENAKKLKNIQLGKGTTYAFRKSSLVSHDEKLESINIRSKTNLSLSQAVDYLKKTRAFFESINYKTVYAQENWSNPTMVKKNLPCIRFVDPEKNTVVEMDPRGQGSVHNIFITYYNYDWFLKKARGEE